MSLFGEVDILPPFFSKHHFECNTKSGGKGRWLIAATSV
jgi:hypothetical protein